jgi:hypothetical protein
MGMGFLLDWLGGKTPLVNNYLGADRFSASS